MPLKGIDISHYNASPDWPAFVREGCDFAIMKSSQGLWTQHSFNGDEPTDGHHQINQLKGARAHGVLPGAYHFLMSRGTEIIRYQVNDAGSKVGPITRVKGAGPPNQATGEQQARYFVALVKRENRDTMDGILACLDWEALNVNLGTRVETGKRFRYVMQSRPDRVDVTAFEREFHRLQPGRPLVIYTTASIFGHLTIRNLRQPRRTYLWVAAWIRQRNSSAAGKPPVVFFKNRINGKVPVLHQYGILHWNGNGLVDTDSFVGDRGQWLRFTRVVGGGDPDPNPDPDPDPDPEDPPPIDPGPGDPPPDDPPPTDPPPVDPGPGNPPPVDPGPGPVNPWPEPWLGPMGNVEPTRVAVTLSEPPNRMLAVGLVVALVGGAGYLAWRSGKLKSVLDMGD